MFIHTERVLITSAPVDIVTYANNNVTFQCQATGIPVPNITWFRNSLPLTEGTRISISSSSMISPNERNTTSVLSISHLQLSDTADYHCVASNPGATGTGVTFTDTSDTVSLLVQCESNIFVMAY